MDFNYKSKYNFKLQEDESKEEEHLEHEASESKEEEKEEHETDFELSNEEQVCNWLSDNWKGFGKNINKKEFAEKNKITLDELNKLIEDGEQVENEEHGWLGDLIAWDHISKEGINYYPSLKEMENKMSKKEK